MWGGKGRSESGGEAAWLARREEAGGGDRGYSGLQEGIGNMVPGSHHKLSRKSRRAVSQSPTYLVISGTRAEQRPV